MTAAHLSSQQCPEDVFFSMAQHELWLWVVITPNWTKWSMKTWQLFTQKHCSSQDRENCAKGSWAEPLSNITLVSIHFQACSFYLQTTQNACSFQFSAVDFWFIWHLWVILHCWHLSFWLVQSVNACELQGVASCKHLCWVLELCSLLNQSTCESLVLNTGMSSSLHKLQHLVFLKCDFVLSGTSDHARSDRKVKGLCICPAHNICSQKRTLLIAFQTWLSPGKVRCWFDFF